MPRLNHEVPGIPASLYKPLTPDGVISSSQEIAIALALGADAVMMGNYFARFLESPSKVSMIDGKPVKEYWMEASARGLNYRRYARKRKNFFEEGIEGYVPMLGSIYDTLPQAKQQLKATLSTSGVGSIRELHQSAVLERQSPAALADSGIHNIIPKLNTDMAECA